jgi:DNA-binding transcriptional LysR family regulator
MIEEIRRFVLVTKNGNLTKTAEQIFITQSALSQSIKRLEKELTTKLFQQKGKNLVLTDDGIAIQAIGERILTLWEKAKDPTRRKTTLPKYTIGAFDNAALRLGKYFQKTFSNESFQIEVTIGATGSLIKQLQLGLCDILICVVEDTQSPPANTELIETFTEKLIPVSSIKYSQPMEQIPFIVYNRGSLTRAQIDRVFTKAGITPKIFAESTSVTFMKELARLGCGVTLLPENFVKTDIQQGLLKKQKLNLNWERIYGIYVQKNGRITKDHQLIKDISKNLSRK